MPIPLTNTLTNSGLPLTFDIEGPNPSSNAEFVLGARSIANSSYDLNFGGRMTGAVFLPSTAPAMFSACVLQCLESLTADTDRTIFDETARTLTIFGPASPADFQMVLRQVVYLNRALNINVDVIRLEVFDGYNTTTAVIEITQGMMRRRRRTTRERAPLRHLLSFHEIDNQRTLDFLEAEPHANADTTSSWFGLHWLAVATAFAVIAIVVAMAIWAIRRRHQQPTLP